MGEVTSHEIFEGLGGNFHEKGLFSVATFGRIGSAARESNFGYIKLGLPVLHPLIYRTVIKLKRFYESLISGHSYAVWDDSIKDFVPSNELEGKTGYAFFLEHYDQIVWKTTDSSARHIRLQLLEKYKARDRVDTWLVTPAGYREIEIGADGRTSMDEINDKYRYLLNQSRGVPEHFGPNDDASIYDRKRCAIQNTINEIYAHYERLMSGKGGYIQARWASRRVLSGTRNVLSSMDTTVADLDANFRPKFNDAIAGIYQSAVGVGMKIIYCLQQNTPIKNIFEGGSNRVELVNPKTLIRNWVELTGPEIERWTTIKGLEKTINELEVADKRSRAVTINGHYLALVYLDDKDNFRVIRDINDIPKGFDKRFARPITYGELVYVAGLGMWNNVAGFVTRYPVENYNSSIPVMLYVKTTVKGQVRHQLNENFERDDSLPVAPEYPILEVNKPAQWHDSLSVSPALLAPLGGDFDGDTASFNMVFSNEAVQEAKDFFNSRMAYLKAGGGLAFSADIITVATTLRYMTGEPIHRD